MVTDAIMDAVATPKFLFRGQECWCEVEGLSGDDILFAFAPTEESSFVDEDGNEYYIESRTIDGVWLHERCYDYGRRDATRSYFPDRLTNEECQQIEFFAEELARYLWGDNWLKGVVNNDNNRSR